jgi:CheY-like chemotaxis protein
VTVSILVVDDESDIADLFRQRFLREVRQGRYAMHFANSGEDAPDKLAGGVEPTLIAILSDINMPGMDGLDLLGELKRRYPELPVMMVTAYEERFPRPRHSDRCRFEEETFAGVSANGRDAPKPAVREAIMEPPGSTRSCGTPPMRHLPPATGTGCVSLGSLTNSFPE